MRGKRPKSSFVDRLRAIRDASWEVAAIMWGLALAAIGAVVAILVVWQALV